MSDLEKQSPTTPDAIPDYIPGKQSWDELVSESSQVIGYDLVKDELLDDMVGVPFLIIKATFTRGIMRQGIAYVPAKVSCECITAPDLNLRKINMARKTNDLPLVDDIEDLPEPNSMFVFNDGSTGIYRQIVEFLESSGRIVLPEGNRNGKMGQSILDLPPSQWARILDENEFWLDDEGFMRYQGNMRLYCPRGVRLSKYENEYNPDGSKTRYLA